MTERLTAGVIQANGAKMAEPRMDLRHVAEGLLYMANLPLDVNVQFISEFHDEGLGPRLVSLVVC